MKAQHGRRSPIDILYEYECRNQFYAVNFDLFNRRESFYDIIYFQLLGRFRPYFWLNVLKIL